VAALSVNDPQRDVGVVTERLQGLLHLAVAGGGLDREVAFAK
jgi:hypothetical protein